MKIGYARVSTIEQNPARQEQALKEAGCEEVYLDYCSGKNAERPELQKMLTYVRRGDTVIVESYSRLARSTKDLFEIIDFIRTKGAEFVSLREKVDTTTPEGRLQLTIFAGLAQFEREILLQRQAEGQKIAKQIDAERIAQGLPPIKFIGGKKKAVNTKDFEREYKKWKAGKQTAVAAMKALNLKPNTFYRRVKEYEQNGKL